MMGERFLKEENVRLDTSRARLSNILRRHGELTERLSRDSDKMIFERLQKEFEAARAAQTQEIVLDGDQWNDGLLATLRERVHMEVERKAMLIDGDMMPDLHFNEKITYRVGNKLKTTASHNSVVFRNGISFIKLIKPPHFADHEIICCLEGARIGIQYETSFAGEPCDLYHCVLKSKSFLEKMAVIEHTVPFFLPLREAENDLLSSNAMKFIDHIGDMLQAYVDRREQVRLIKELYGNQTKELYYSIPYHMIDFLLDDFDCMITVSLRYADLDSVLPTKVSVLAWPVRPTKKLSSVMRRKEDEYGSESNAKPVRLPYAEVALQTMSLPEAYAEIVLNLPRALEQEFSRMNSP